MDMIIIGILYFAGCLMFAGLGIWYVHLALSCKHMVTATLMKIEYRSAPKSYSMNGFGCTLHFHVKGDQARKYKVDNVFYWIGNRMEKHKKYSIYVSSDGKHAILNRLTYSLLGILFISLSIFFIYQAIPIILVAI
ncbi:hypothetical protein D6853_08840 [Butyrivibrio sp. X503]|uniref:hypothetical protein n=1 Tax=Butyrivibrio sp. X503 TaxID=2364878 RepID=UPI000EA843F8|nr:hypothetical protein [Butyrivibrio sp. X503]RKM55651.1 hypothetical protein D6853_08840 [Butyrivibrio sp. X503]